MDAHKLRLYFDYKSPYSYLIKDEAYKIEREFNVEIEWLPFDLNIYTLRSEDVELNIMKTKYVYQDVRRFANERNPPLIIKGPEVQIDNSD